MIEALDPEWALNSDDYRVEVKKSHSGMGKENATEDRRRLSDHDR